MRRSRSAVCVLLALTVLMTGFGAGEACAEDVDVAVRKARLKIRTREWLQARKQLFYRAGRRVRVSRKRFFKLHYDMRSPAWRARQGAPETLEATYRAMDGGKGRPRAVTRSVVTGVKLVTARLGIGRYKMNGLAAVREVRWIWVRGAEKKKGDWYLYGGDVDGPWIKATCDASPSRRRALPKDAAARLTKTLAALKLTHTVTAVAAAGTNDLVVVLTLQGAQTAKARSAALRADQLAVLRAVLPGPKDCTGLRLAFLADWVDKFGRVHVRPVLHTCMTRTTFERIVFDNLKPKDVLALFVGSSFEHKGLQLRTP